MAVKPLAPTDADMSKSNPLQSLPVGDFEDSLELAGLVVGAFLILVGLATLAGTPWTNKNSVVLMLGQIVGALGTAAIGVGLIWLTRTDD